MAELPHDITRNTERFSGFSSDYDAFRPITPPVVVELLCQLAQVTGRPRVVDIGSGTGLSTRAWAACAEEVIGIEPNDDMRDEAESRSTGLTNVHYRKGVSSATGLATAWADIVTVAQALHWMEPDITFSEVARIMRPGGVFAAVDYDLMPAFYWEAEALFQNFHNSLRSIVINPDPDEKAQEWSKEKHLERITASGHFRYTREIAVHHVDSGDAERLVGLALTYGRVQTLLKHGVTEDQLGVPAFRAEAKRMLGDQKQPWYFVYRIRFGVR